MQFRLNVVQGRGTPRTLVLDAIDLEDARRQAASSGYAVLSSSPAGPTAFGQLFAIRRTRLSPADVSVLIEQLRDLLAAGLSVVEAMRTLQMDSRLPNAEILRSVSSSLADGNTLSAALASQEVFPELLVALVRAAELTSDLPQALDRFLDHQKRVSELRHRLVSVAIYPTLLTVVGFVVLAFLLFYVVPRFARVFEGMNGGLPWTANAMVWWSRFLGEHAAAIAILAVAIGGCLVAALMMPSLRAKAIAAISNANWLRGIVRTYVLSRWYRTTGMLLSGGIPLAQALSLCNSLLPASTAAGAARALQCVRDGHSPADAYSMASMATPVAAQLLRAGERTGDLGSVLARIAEYHESEVSRRLERFMRAFEPVVMVTLGVGVGTVVVLMYLPIFELASSIR